MTEFELAALALLEEIRDRLTPKALPVPVAPVSAPAPVAAPVESSS